MRYPTHTKRLSELVDQLAKARAEERRVANEVALELGLEIPGASDLFRLPPGRKRWRSLSPEQKAALVEKRARGQSFAQIAAETGLSDLTVRKAVRNPS